MSNDNYELETTKYPFIYLAQLFVQKLERPVNSYFYCI